MSAAINDDMFLRKTMQLGEQIGVTDLSYHRVYLHGFKSRRGINRKHYEAKADSANLTAVQSGGQDLQRAVQVYDQEDSSTDPSQTTP